MRPRIPLYTVQVVGGSHRYLADAAVATWSPDGKLVAYSTPNGDINIINSDGTGAHKLASAGGVAYRPQLVPRRQDYSVLQGRKPLGNNIQRFQPSSVARGLAPLREEVLRPLVARRRDFSPFSGPDRPDPLPDLRSR